MAKSTFVLKKKPRSASIQFAEYREEIREAVRETGKAHVKSREKVVANWSDKSRPKFSFKTTVTLFKIALEILVTEANRRKPVWKWIDKTGTKAHQIGPKPNNRLQRLFFQWGGPGSYQPKTAANPARYGGPGRVSGGKLAVAKQVQHPGFEAREFSDQINKDLEKDMERQLRNAGRRGLRKAKAAR